MCSAGETQLSDVLSAWWSSLPSERLCLRRCKRHLKLGFSSPVPMTSSSPYEPPKAKCPPNREASWVREQAWRRPGPGPGPRPCAWSPALGSGPGAPGPGESRARPPPRSRPRFCICRVVAPSAQFRDSGSLPQAVRTEDVFGLFVWPFHAVAPCLGSPVELLEVKLTKWGPPGVSRAQSGPWEPPGLPRAHQPSRSARGLRS